LTLEFIFHARRKRKNICIYQSAVRSFCMEGIFDDIATPLMGGGRGVLEARRNSPNTIGLHQLRTSRVEGNGSPGGRFERNAPLSK
jgi:hypothetical protein